MRRERNKVRKKEEKIEEIRIREEKIRKLADLDILCAACDADA